MISFEWNSNSCGNSEWNHYSLIGCIHNRCAYLSDIGVKGTEQKMAKREAKHLNIVNYRYANLFANRSFERVSVCASNWYASVCLCMYLCLHVLRSFLARPCMCAHVVHWRHAAYRLIRSSWLLFSSDSSLLLYVLRHCGPTQWCAYTLCIVLTHTAQYIDAVEHKESELPNKKNWMKKKTKEIKEENKNKQTHNTSHSRILCKSKRVLNTSMRLLGNFSLFSLFTSNECVYFSFLFLFFRSRAIRSRFSCKSFESVRDFAVKKIICKFIAFANWINFVILKIRKTFHFLYFGIHSVWLSVRTKMCLEVFISWWLGNSKKNCNKKTTENAIELYYTTQWYSDR